MKRVVSFKKDTQRDPSPSDYRRMPAFVIESPAFSWGFPDRRDQNRPKTTGSFQGGVGGHGIGGHAAIVKQNNGTSGSMSILAPARRGKWIQRLNVRHLPKELALVS